MHISFSESFYLSGLGLKGLYQVDHVHLHWGDNVLLGSEHSLNGRHYPLEVLPVTDHSIHSSRSNPPLVALHTVCESESTSSTEYSFQH